jgi:potassium efflux system protein
MAEQTAEATGMRAPMRPGVCLMALLWLLGTAGALAQEPTAEPLPELSVEDFQDRIERVEADQGLAEPAKEELLETYRDAAAQLERAAELKAKAAEFEAEQQAAPGLLEQLRAELAGPAPEVEVEPPPDATLADLERGLTEAEAALAAAQAAHRQLEDEPSRRSERRAEIPRLLSEAERTLAEIQQQLATKLPEGADELARAERILLRARSEALRHEVAAYRAEVASYDARRELLGVRREKASRELRAAEERVSKRRELVQRRRREEAREAIAEARRLAADAHPGLRELAGYNEALARRWAATDGPAARAADASRELQEANSQLTDVKVDFARMRAQVEPVGLTKAVGALLRKERADLPDPRECRRRVRTRQSTLSDVQLELLALEEEWSKLADAEAETTRILAAVEAPLSEQEREELRQTAAELVRARRDLLGSLIRDYNGYFTALLYLNLAEEQVASVSQEYADYIDEKIFWFRSTAPVRWQDVHEAGEALIALVAPATWVRAGSALLRDVPAQPVAYGAALLLIALWLRIRGRVRAKLRRNGELSRSAETDSFSLTLGALALTLAASLFGPALVWFVGWRLVAAAETPELARAAGWGLTQTSAIYLTLAFVRQLCADQGLADSHFRWPERARRMLRRNLAWLRAGVLPLLAVFLTLAADGIEGGIESLGRLLLTAVLALFAAFLWHVLSPRRGVLREAVSRRPGGWLERLRYVWYPGAVGLPLALGLAALGGYLYTARELAARLLWTAWLTLGLVVAYELVLRWLFVARRGLAMERARKRREEAGGPAEGGAPESGAPVEEEQVSIHAISAQTRQLAVSGVAVGLIAGLWFVWGPVLPALGMLSTVTLWGTVTLADAGIALLIVALSVVAARNIPGLLEIAVLQHLPIEAGVRFAIITICRYVLGIIGLVLAFQAVGVSWDKVQWLAAAITVGLGFGLQEIFANFVSGLIILLERPMRVGDTVTVGDITGTVTRIHMRATTITDWDRKELVVPNREFITGRLVNWTLSDRILRLVVPVGVAYGSDTQKAADLLMKVAREHPDVLDDPEPSVIFMDFGASSLDLELRAFIPTVEVLLKVRHDLHMAIDRAFREAGIEIAFPQHDVHIRSIRPALRLEGSKVDLDDSGRGS